MTPVAYRHLNNLNQEKTDFRNILILKNSQKYSTLISILNQDYCLLTRFQYKIYIKGQTTFKIIAIAIKIQVHKGLTSFQKFKYIRKMFRSILSGFVDRW